MTRAESEVVESESEALLARAFEELKRGRYDRAWGGYEERFTARGACGPDARRLWHGEPLQDRTIFVHREQGIGDEVLFASCYPDLLAHGGRCIVSCDERLTLLLRRSMPAAEFLPIRPAKNSWKVWPDPPGDFHIASGSLPRFFRPHLTAFPPHRGFLRADPDRTRIWRERFGAIGRGPKVGVSWQGGQDLENLRHAPWSFWTEILRVPGVHLVSIQYGGDQAIQALQRQLGMRIHRPQGVDLWKDLDELAAVISALDLIVTVTNSVAHLAGALGIPTWVPFTPSWGAWWILESGVTPWYPSLRIYSKRSAREDWAGITAEMVADLGAFGKGSGSTTEHVAVERTPALMT